MTRWSFEGVLLPDGEPGRVVVPADGGDGTPEPLPGRYALTGLVDAHCHLMVSTDDEGPYLDGNLAGPRLQQLAREGVVAVRDVGGDRSVTLDLARGTFAGRTRVLAAGRFFAPARRYFPRMHVPVPGEYLVDAVIAEVEAGAQWVKLVADFPSIEEQGRFDFATNVPCYDDATVAAAVGAAHERGARVAAHTLHPVVVKLVEAGIDSVEHGTALEPDTVYALRARGGGDTDARRGAGDVEGSQAATG